LYVRAREEGQSSVTDALSLFFPMYNEEGNIDQAVASALAALAPVSDRYEVIVVDDGSRDRTRTIADRLAAANPLVRVIHHSFNRGYGAALRSGFQAATYSLVVLADGDNQFDLGELSILVRALEGFDVVSGYRITRRDPAIRRLYAFLYNRLARLLFDIPVRDVNCGFKIYRRDLLERLLPQLRSTGALINVEMLARARKLGARVTEVGVHHYPRETGRPTGGNPAVILRAFRELLRLWRELR
jgi:glycosyltransferase involved in cell wall biosynthesis